MPTGYYWEKSLAAAQTRGDGPMPRCPMPLRALEADVARLALLAEWLIDGDFLVEEEGEAFLALIESARRDLAMGGEEDAGRQIAQFVQRLEALMQAGQFDAATEQVVCGAMPGSTPGEG
jgi:hypothetical protein